MSTESHPHPQGSRNNSARRLVAALHFAALILLGLHLYVRTLPPTPAPTEAAEEPVATEMAAEEATATAAPVEEAVATETPVAEATEAPAEEAATPVAIEAPVEEATEAVATEAPAEEAATVTPPAAGFALLTAEGARLRVRAEANTDAAIVGWVQPGETVPVVEVSADGLWVKIGPMPDTQNPDGGWVSAEFLVLGQ